MRNLFLTAALSRSLLVLTLAAAWPTLGRPQTPVPETLEAYNQRVAWFADAQYGLFIHFGLYSQLGGEWQGEQAPRYAEWIQASKNIPREEYAQLIQHLNPTRFDAQAIVAAAKDAGMPFVFAGEGVDVTPLGRDTFDGKTYDYYKATFSVGYSPKDEYRIWVDPASHKLKMVEFRVTHPAVQGDKPLSQAIREYLVFEEWAQVGGLLVPTRATFYLSDGKFEKLGDLVGTYTTTGLSFDTQPPADTLFGEAGGGGGGRSGYGY